MTGPSRPSYSRRLSALGVAALLGWASPVLAQSPTGDLVSRSELRVCADPNNLPFSNEAGEGFENKIAEALGQELSLPVKFTWFPQIIGFVRNTLQAGRCDLVIGTVAGDETMQTTTPYYYTSYVVVFRADKELSFADFSDPKLKSLHIGVVAGTPPANLLVRYDLMANVRPYALTVDTRYESPAHQIVADVASGAIDAAMLWGPIAGYYIQRDKLPLTLVRLKTEPDTPRMEYHIAMGVRANDVDWRRRINDAIHKRQAEITGILRDYGVPLLDELGNPLQP
jgi:quinoprotein dehydrogenase-associated probable ABC transporter substrate-binding protein